MTSVRELTGNKKKSLSLHNMHFGLRKFDKFTAELHPIEVKDQVWDMIGVDLIGPLPTTSQGNKYIMTVSCLFSKWPEATALKRQLRVLQNFCFIALLDMDVAV